MRPDPASLRALPLFAALSDSELKDLAAHLEVREASPGEHLTRQGGSGYFFFVIEAGTAAVERDGEVVAHLGPGDFFGEGAILGSVRRNATVTAMSPMHLVAMFGADFAKLNADAPAVAATVQAEMQRRRELPSA